jgi:hypothetical protein
VKRKSPSVTTVCLNELRAPVIVTDFIIVTNDHIAKCTKVKAPSVNSAISVNAEDTCISIFAPDEYTPVPN